MLETLKQDFLRLPDVLGLPLAGDGVVDGAPDGAIARDDGAPGDTTARPNGDTPPSLVDALPPLVDTAPAAADAPPSSRPATPPPGDGPAEQLGLF